MEDNIEQQKTTYVVTSDWLEEKIAKITAKKKFDDLSFCEGQLDILTDIRDNGVKLSDKSKVLITVRGGIIESVTASLPTDIVVCDYDNIEAGTTYEEQCEVESVEVYDKIHEQVGDPQLKQLLEQLNF